MLYVWSTPEDSTGTDTPVCPVRLKTAGRKPPLTASLARKQNPLALFPPQSINTINTSRFQKTVEHLARRPTLDRSHSPFSSCCMGFNFPQQSSMLRISFIFTLHFLNHKSLWILDSASHSSHLQTSLLPCHCSVGVCSQLQSVSNSAQKAKLL